MNIQYSSVQGLGPLGLFVSTPNGPSLLCFEVFCWLYRFSFDFDALSVCLLQHHPQPFSSWLHLICCGLGNQITELIKIMSKIRSSRLWVTRASCVLWTVWSLWLIRDLFYFLFFFFCYTDAGGFGVLLECHNIETVNFFILWKGKRLNVLLHWGVEDRPKLGY